MTMAMFVGMALTAPAIITPLVALLAKPLRRIAPTGGRLAADATRRNPGRTASTAVALTIGLSVIVVNASMSASFIDSVHDRIDSTYARDVTVRPVGATLTSARTISPTAVRAVSALPDAEVVSPVRDLLIEFPGIEDTAQPYGIVEGVDPQTILAVDRPDPEGLSDADVPAALQRGEVLVGRAYAKDRGLDIGETIHIAGPAATDDLKIAGIYDVFNDVGGNNIRMSLDTMERLYGRGDPTQLLLQAPSPERRVALNAEVDQLISSSHPYLESQSTAQLKDEISDQINQQFALFNAIVAIAVIVSLLGIVNTLAMSVAERTREIGVLRALGSSRWLVRLTMVDEALLMTTAGAIAGLGLGAIIAFAWVSSIGSVLPDITFHLPLGLILGVAVAAIVLGLLAALLPARRAARVDVVDALAYE
jgi:putative ABC transport system permease protein